MSIATDQAVIELQKKVAWLEKEIAQLKNEYLKAAPVPAKSTLKLNGAR